MKAIKCLRYGPPEVLKLVNMDKPKPKSHEILIKNFAATVTAADCRVRGFVVPPNFRFFARLALGILKPRKSILGNELSGIIEQTGKNVSKFKTGDEVFAFTSNNSGAYAEYICLDENQCIALKPKNMNFGQSAALSFGGITALYFLQSSKIKAGESILIYGASGSVGTYAVQLAKFYGADVTGVCSTDNLELVLKLGANNVIDYSKTDLAGISNKFDIFFDAVGKADISKSIALIKQDGRYIHTVTDPFTEKKIMSKLSGIGIKLIGGTYKANTDQINQIGKLAAEGAIIPVIDKIYNFNEIIAAHEYADKGHKKGNVIIKIIDDR